MAVTLQHVVAAVCVAVCSLASISTASAVTISVPATATGGFGSPPPPNGYTDFVLGTTVTFSGETSKTVRITASGSIAIGLTENPTPDGVLWQLTNSGDYTPLEEKIIDASGTLPARTRDVPNTGGLIYAFVPVATASASGFAPRDEDLTGSGLGIDSQLLFLAGSGPTDVTVTEPGSFYLGINDAFATNNSGSFSVTLDEVAAPVPEPSSLVLLSFGMACLLRTRRRR